MEPSEILKTFNSCYIQLQAIAQDSRWLALSNLHDVDPEMKIHLGDVLHYLGKR
ncbi:hypothetical protein H6G76_21415 [Nostoc sp. FACHB-152]|uniref:hypothetical protein n=1 Tax=unclassified Nostoc TaxID=2593658 RepID=UPI001687BE30|nr:MULTISPECIES: hypothetical protein [unclassified Nostoc]MBD2449679.1 hypothetical protein [Nostoc sp. FACHB-152]MBD2469657.1 hypothetical protein [Nostoc sp. FACHB-145]